MRGIDLRIAIATRYEAGLLPQLCTADDFKALGTFHSRTLSTALTKLGFTQTAKRRRSGYKPKKGRRRVTIYPAKWEAPPTWPPMFEVERRLRETYRLSPGQVDRASGMVYGLVEMLTKAIDVLVIDGMQPAARGTLTRQIREVMIDTYADLRYDNVPRRELAGWLGEAPDANRQYLENRIKGLIRALNKRSSSP